jgi:hypothetical protein
MSTADIALVWLYLFMGGYALVLLVLGYKLQRNRGKVKPCDCVKCPAGECQYKESTMDADIEKQVQDRLVDSSIEAAILRNLVPHLAHMARKYATSSHPNVAAHYNEIARELLRIGIPLIRDQHDGMKIFADETRETGSK